MLTSYAHLFLLQYVLNFYTIIIFINSIYIYILKLGILGLSTSYSVILTPGFFGPVGGC